MANQIKQAVLLSAGLGIRMREVTGNLIPKVMVPLLGKPLLEWHIDLLKRYGFDEFFINLHYLPDVITNYFGDGSKWGVKITYAFETPEIRGTAGGIKNFDESLREKFLVLYADTFYKIDFERLINFYTSLADPIGVTTARRTDHPMDSDLAVLGKDNRIVEFLLKPHKELPEDYWGTSAPYIFSQKVLQYIPEWKYYEIDHNLVPDLLAQGFNYYGCPLVEGEFRKDIGTPERYKQVEEYLVKRKEEGSL